MEDDKMIEGMIMLKRFSMAAVSAAALLGVSGTAQAWPVTANPTLAATAAAAQSQTLTVMGETLPHEIWHVLLLPGEALKFALAPGQSADLDGETVASGWTPEVPGNHTLVVKALDGSVAARVSVFVMVPSTEIDSRGYIGKFRIGTYPKDTPRGFIRLDEADMKRKVSPHFTVGQFICKQQPGLWPKYLLVSGANLERLETLLASLREDELTDADTLFVMSGWRSPFYNTAIGSAKFSRHMYGDAADVYVDHAPRDGNMDDINGDGKVTKADANFLYDYSADLFAEEDVDAGGLGSYKANAVHGPFIHVDARGSIARWGR